ncbi:uncharacterized protein LTR77_004796 [Saxophila tyrrhenica]|uniref:Uncharacterized protein n=1 Tax=Saxophila tyrrhenica TaxID=1690608 RepID=A0AAV9PDA7_9PEZI|nr:hypothetical protein LTR77_004796 [Saxophila tyrrhenica]
MEPSSNNSKLTPLGALGRLPGELRNQLYDIIVSSQEDVSVNADGRLFQHPLSQTSKEVQKEFHPLWYAGVLTHTPTVKVHLRNFVYRSPSPLVAFEAVRSAKTISAITSETSIQPPISLEAIVHSLPTPASNVNRTTVIRIWLTNPFDSDVQLRKFCSLMPMLEHQLQDTLKVEIRWDRESFDTNYCQELLERLGFRHYGPWLTHEGQAVLAGRILRAAFAEAFVRYEGPEKDL